jgi:hypothetical protein
VCVCVRVCVCVLSRAPGYCTSAGFPCKVLSMSCHVMCGMLSCVCSRPVQMGVDLRNDRMLIKLHCSEAEVKGSFQETEWWLEFTS